MLDVKAFCNGANLYLQVWIYGGAFIIGSGANKAYNGALLADEYDVVVVNLK